jgi:SAM-dependent methyltransferase
MDDVLSTHYGQIARYYDLIHADLTADIDFFLWLANGKQRSVLELGCGTGRIAFPLAHAGHTVLGLDHSREMLALAQAKLALEHVDIRQSLVFVEGDMTDFDFGQQYDLVITANNTLHELPRDMLNLTFERIRKHLSPEGMIILDLANPSRAFQMRAGDGVEVEERVFRDPESDSLIRQSSSFSIDPPRQQMTVEWVYEKLGSDTSSDNRIVHRTVYHLIYPHELELLLESKGFVLTQLYGGYDRKSYIEESDKMIAVARFRAKRST